MADGGGIIEAGILLSRSVDFGDCECKPVELKDGLRDFKSVSKLDPGSTYYYRAYARNEAGENRKCKKLRFPSIDKGSHGGVPRSIWEWVGRSPSGLVLFVNRTTWIGFTTWSLAGVMPTPIQVRISGFGLMIMVVWTQEGIWPYLWQTNQVNGFIFLPSSKDKDFPQDPRMENF